jgi:putative DNA primase/helicase
LEKLLSESSGILNWALKGLANWRRGGLVVPTSISQATSSYRNEQDVLEQFLEERCRRDSASQVQSNELYLEYLTWCRNTGESPVCKRDFGVGLEEKGFVKTRTSTARKWAGLKLLNGDNDE